MIINKTSWHYRLNRDLNGSYYPTNLCSYFWVTIGSLLKCLVGIIACCFFIGCIIWVAVKFPIIVGFVISSILIPTTAIYYFQKIFPTEKTEVHAPSFVVEYFKAKKNKYCPTIEYK